MELSNQHVAHMNAPTPPTFIWYVFYVMGSPGEVCEPSMTLEHQQLSPGAVSLS
jgi:hypothetical protein